MKKHMIYGLVLTLLLTGCGQRAETTPPLTEPAPETSASGAVVSEPEEQQVLEPASVRPEKSEIQITVQSKTEIQPVKLHVGRGYSIYITEEGWRFEQDLEDGKIMEDTWESTAHGHDAELKVSIYPDATAEVAKARFAAEEDDYLFESQLTGDWGDPMRGRDEVDKEMLHFMVVERNEDAYVISWHYDDRVADLYGAQLRQMADTFLLTE